MSLRCRDRVTCSPDGPGTAAPPGIVKTVTRSACCSSGMANAIARACSVLPFHAISTLVAICFGGDGGDSRIGRPLSNRPDSKARWCQAERRSIGPAQDDEVEDPAIAADDVLALGGVVQPAERKAGCRLTGTRNAMLLHEGLEHGLRLLRLLDALAPERFRRGCCRPYPQRGTR